MTLLGSERRDHRAWVGSNDNGTHRSSYSSYSDIFHDCAHYRSLSSGVAIPLNPATVLQGEMQPVSGQSKK